MPYMLVIPAGYAAAYAAGQVTLMTTAAGATTTLVGTGGTIVGTATLIEASGAAAGGTAAVSGGGAAAAGTATICGVAAAPLLIAGGAALLVAGVGVGAYLLWRNQQQKAVERERAGNPLVVELPAESDPAAALLEAQEIVDREYARVGGLGVSPRVVVTDEAEVLS